ncbi:hypothetical protein D3C84_523170 [compost metagenome]
MPLADLDETLRRQAEDGAAAGQCLVAGEGRRAGGAQGLVGGPGITLAGGLEALGEVHLVAVAGLDIGLHPFDGLAVARLFQIGAEGAAQAEGAGAGLIGFAEQGDQALPFLLVQARVEHQLAAACLVVADQRPSVEAQLRIRQVQVVDRLFRQLLHAAAEVVGQVADEPADERQIDSRWQPCLAKSCQGRAQALGEVVGRFARLWCQFCQWPGAE